MLRGNLRCDDTEVLAAALGALGVALEWRDGDLWIGGVLPNQLAGSVELGENGTALRLLTVVTAMLAGRVRFDGREGLRRRPLEPVLDILGQAGVVTSASALPLEIDGTGAEWPAVLRIDAQLTTQPASGALLGCALRARRGWETPRLRVVAPSAPGYLELTARMLEQFGHRVTREPTDREIVLAVDGAPGPAPADYAVPADASAAAFPAALAALHGIPWAAAADGDDPHPDLAMSGDLARLVGAPEGAAVELAELGQRPDSVPALAVVAALRTGSTAFVGVPALRAKESDRIDAMCAGLTAAGVRCDEMPDGFVVHGPMDRAGAQVALPATADHRIVMALALLGTVRSGGVVVPHPGAVGKSWPGYWDWLGRVAGVSRR